MTLKHKIMVGHWTLQLIFMAIAYHFLYRGQPNGLIRCIFWCSLGAWLGIWLGSRKRKNS